MSSALEIDGKKFYPIKIVASEVSYSRDYITRLAREGKITATNVGRQWFVDLESLKSYSESSTIEADIRKKRLSEERKIEQEKILAVNKKKSQREVKVKYFNAFATVTASLVLTFGLLGGWATYYILDLEAYKNIALNSFVVTQPQVGLVPVSENIKVSTNVSPSVINSETIQQPSQMVRPIGDDVASGVLLLPQGGANAYATEMFSDEVKVITADDGTQMIVRVDEYGNPTGNIIPFVVVPVNNSDR